MQTAPLLVALFLATVASLHAQSTTTIATHPFPGDPNADIWLLAGQSNMFGSASLPDQLQYPDPRIQLFNMDDTWIVAQEPLHRIFQANAPIITWFRLNDGMTTAQIEAARAQARTKPGGSGVGPGLFFARHVVEALDRPLGLIPNSPGGSSMEHWSPDLRERHGDSLYGAMMDRVAMTGSRPKGLIWYQGESEANDTRRASEYKDALVKLFTSVRRDTNAPDLPIIFVQIGRYTKSTGPVPSANWEKVREAQRQVAQLLPHTYMVSAIDLPLTDNIHINYDAQCRLGRRIAEVALTHVCSQPGHGSPIDVESAQVSSLDGNGRQTTAPTESIIRVKFKGVTGKLTASGRPTGFELRYPGHVHSGSDDNAPQPYQINFDPADSTSVLLYVRPAIPYPAQLVYGGGTNPYVNITDEQDIAVPAFGPIELRDSSSQSDSTAN